MKKIHNSFNCYPFLLSLIILLPLTQGCGRKQNNLFNFETKKANPYSRLKLPAPKLIMLKEEDEVITLHWLAPQDIPENSTLHGYVLYLLSNNTLINHEPYKFLEPTKQTFHDHSEKRPIGYLIRGLYNINTHLFQGASSNILILKKVPPT